MSQLSQHPAYALIEDQLDAIGQKYRALRIVRGMMLFLAVGAMATFAAAMAACYAEAGRISYVILVLWAVAVGAAGIWWLIRPLLLRPRAVEVARMVEGKVPDLHNGLTNSVLLARAGDLRDSPWLEPIFEEIASATRSKPLGQAVTVRDLAPSAMRFGIVAAALLIAMAFPAVRLSFLRGWRQMLNPTTFVPKIGSVQLVSVSPKEITLVVGQPLEITVLAVDPAKGMPAGTLMFDNPKLAKAEMVPTPTGDDQLRYSYRMEHVDESMRWRVEVGGSESEWCIVNVVKQVKLQQVSLTVTPPIYTKKAGQALTLKPDQIEKTPVAVLEGSKVELTAVVDVPVKDGMLQVDQESPVAMTAAMEDRQFSASFTVLRNVEVAVLLNEAGQVIAKLPDPALRIACTKDAAPTIEMKWPTQDVAVSPKAELKVAALLKDDLGLTGARLLMATGPDQPLAPVQEKNYTEQPTSDEFSHVLSVPAEARVHGRSVRIQIEATDNRNLTGLSGPGAPASAKDSGPQLVTSPIYEIKFRDPEEIAKEQKEQFDKLRTLIMEMIKKQQGLMASSVAWKPAMTSMPKIHDGQVELRKMMGDTASTFPFEPEDKLVQKTLLVLVANTAKEAVDLAAAVQGEPVEAEKVKTNRELQTRQRRIIDVLETLLSRLNTPTSPTTQPGKQGGDLDNDKEKFKDLNEALKKFMEEEKRILDATATLAKKPVDNFDDKDKKLLEELKLAQEKMDAFMQEKISDFSKLAEQDQANGSLLKDMLQVYSEVTMAKDALKEKAVEMAIPAEEMGMELAKEISSNIEKWLSDKPDRQKWNQEDMPGKQDIPMAELPKELEDMVGELLEQQEDLFEEMEDTAANWADSVDKGAGWDAMDGPIANMSAKGVTGNQLPNNNEMNGRSGEGRSGKSSGEFVGDTAVGKGGRNTPTRLDPTPFAKGQIKDESKDPVGGATGGGKMSGQGGAGLEGPVSPKDMQEKMERLATKQAELRNKAERLQLDQKAAPYDNFKLMNAVALMRRVESDLRGNRYQTALRRKDMVLDKLDTSHLLLSGQIHLQKDTSPQMSEKLQEQINDVVNGQLPAAWSEALKEYYKKLSQQ